MDHERIAKEGSITMLQRLPNHVHTLLKLRMSLVKESLDMSSMLFQHCKFTAIAFQIGMYCLF
jgi:hypothetical protein